VEAVDLPRLSPPWMLDPENTILHFRALLLLEEVAAVWTSLTRHSPHAPPFYYYFLPPFYFAPAIFIVLKYCIENGRGRHGSQAAWKGQNNKAVFSITNIF